MSHGDTIRDDIGPFTIVPKWLLAAEVDGKRLSSRAVHLFVVLSMYANRDGTGAFPGRERLADDLGGCSVDTVDRALNELKKVGAVSVSRVRRPGGQWATNEYVVHHAAPVRTGEPTMPHPCGTTNIQLGSSFPAETADTASHDETEASKEAGGEPSSPPVLQVVSEDELPINTAAIGAYIAVGGDLTIGKGDRRDILAGSAKQLLAHGFTREEVLAAAEELGRANAPPLLPNLRAAAERFRAEGRPCKWGATGLDDLRILLLRECGCRLCEEYVAYKLAHGEAA